MPHRCPVLQSNLNQNRSSRLLSHAGQGERLVSVGMRPRLVIISTPGRHWQSAATMMKMSNANASAKYCYMDSNLTQLRRRLEEEVPDIKMIWKMVEFLRDRRVSDIYEGCGATFCRPSAFSHYFLLSNNLSDI
jgi:hypothetical protein